ncbi:putative ubiquitin-like-specific protease 1B isoform X2 [Cynara cardunculus var. scolymus]|uniref:putative ubiquitin-like-specific protease 1B isoform X2 n=1 Tax=Cynara cardunculus var. scolymus TaxID=59895 RepID=UPI000D62B521|nr:putative ubiquitin-like-specific protease 1B isoform X2 [Cynara cardunculus var. scolymus]
MGALTSNRNKRAAEFQPSPPSGSGYNLLYVAKKLKPSPSSSSCKAPTPTKTSRSSVSRLSLYPQQNSDFPGDGMDKDLFSKYTLAKESAIGSCRHVVFEEEMDVVEVIDVDNQGTVKDDKAASGSSSIEEVEMVEDEKEDIHRSGEAQEIAAKYRELDQKAPSTSSEVVSELTNGKMLELLSLNRESKVFDVDRGLPVHKKLHQESAEKRDPRLRRLSFSIELYETKRALLMQSHPAKKKEDVTEAPFMPLTEDEEEMVDNALSNSYRRKILVTHEKSNITITGEVLQCLRPRAWLNDEVINVYLELLKERENREPKKFLKCHFFNTFFYKKLASGRTGYDYKSVRRWTTQKKLGYGLLECDKIFVPIHKEIHWCLAVINKKEGKFQYLDSLRGADKKVLRVLAKYVTDEVKDKTGKDIDVTSWDQEFVTDLPNQENGFDCGMFMIKYADFYSRDIGLCFNQEHMPYFRLRTAKEILRLKAD